MNKHTGFTLIELIGVIIVLGAIGLITYTAVDKTIKDNKEKLYNMQIDSIAAAAEVWANNNINYLPEGEGEYVTITLATLQKDGLIDFDLVNQKTGEYFYRNMLIGIRYWEGNYRYIVFEDSGTDDYNDLDNLNIPLVIIKGDPYGLSGFDDLIIVLMNGEEVSSYNLGNYNDVVISSNSDGFSVTEGNKSFSIKKIDME